MLPSPPLESVAAVARVPDHDVVAALAEDLIVSRPAGQDVFPVASEEEVIAGPAVEGVRASLA